jgi:hypothetical protein
MSERTQMELIMGHLERRRKGITSWDAITEYGITRLAKYIHELRRMGWSIIDNYEYDKESNRKWKRYRLLGSPRAARVGKK